MRYVRERGPIPLLGVEAEVLGWQGNKQDIHVVKALVAKGAMPKGMYESPHVKGSGYGPNAIQHSYHCKCKPCYEIGSKPYYPPQFKVQYDGTLPTNGAEFISSPFPAAIPLIDDVVDSLTIIGDNAIVDATGLVDKYGRPAAAGLHVHASVQLTEYQMERGLLADAIRIFYLYFPEIFLLASSTGRRRVLQYRWPTYKAQDHHSFLIQSRGHLEWRMFEADLQSPDYLFGSMVIAASLTYLMQEPKVMAMLEAIGGLDRWDAPILDMLYEPTAMDDLPEGALINVEANAMMEQLVMESVSRRRMDALSTVLEELTYSLDVWKRLNEYLERAWAYAS